MVEPYRIFTRPTKTLDVERAAVHPRPFHYEFSQRTVESRNWYDVRYVGQYSHPFAFVAGWWRTYYGWIPIPKPTLLHPSHPYHHPWVITHEFGGFYKQAQRAPVKPESVAGCWWAIELRSDLSPAMQVPDLVATPPVQPMPASLDVRSAATVRGLSDTAEAVLALPYGTLAGLSQRTSYGGIAAWAWACARWAHDNPANDNDTLITALHDFQLSVMAGAIIVPRTVREVIA